MHRFRGVTLVEVTVLTMSMLGALVLLQPGLNGARQTARQMQSATQLRGIHQSMSVFAQGNRAGGGNGWYPGVSPRGEIINTDPAYIYETLLDADFFPPETLISPADHLEAAPEGEQLDSSHFSYGTLLVDPGSNRYKEWSDNLNTQAVILSDRNTNPNNPQDPRSIWSEEGWRGQVTYNDGATALENEAQVITRYGGVDNEADNLFKVSGDSDALIVHSDTPKRRDAFATVRNGKAQYAVVPVYFGTNRKPEPRGDDGTHYGETYQREIAYGQLSISIPAVHEVGKIERPGYFDWRGASPYHHVTILDDSPLSAGDFIDAIRKRVVSSKREAVLVFIHGFNNDFTEAAHRTAQITYDLRFDGAAVMYSWPSLGEPGPLDYAADKEMADRCVDHAETFLRHVFDEFHEHDIFIIAHSMGARVCGKALKQLASDQGYLTKFNDRPPVSHIFFAAADVDQVLFRDQIVPKLRAICGSSTLYASSKDRALLAAMKIAGDRPRAGLAGKHLVIQDGLDTVDVSLLPSADFNRHSYIGNSYSLLADLFLATRHKLKPEKRCLVTQQIDLGQYWSFVPNRRKQCDALLKINQ